MKSNIGELIDKNGFKRSYVAKQVEVGAQQLYNWCSGRSYPTIPKAFKLAKILNCKVDDLFSLDGE